MSLLLRRLFCTLAVAVVTIPLVAEGLEAQRSPWKVEAEFGGSHFFGNREQTNVSTGGEIQRADSVFESSTTFRFNYGTTTNDEGESLLSRRSWTARAELSFRPRERWQPFVSGEMHSSYERRTALRYDTGAGLKMSFQDAQNRRNRIDFALQVMAERAYARVGARGGTPDDVALARWSSTLRVRRSILDNRLSLDSNNAYNPVFDALGTFRMSSRNSFSYSLTEVLRLRFGVRANYDSRQKLRGSDTNWDGTSEVTLVAQF